jgi:hypothetical protein
MSGPPHARGARLGVVIGSSLAGNPFPPVAPLEVAVEGGDGAEHAVSLDDCGHFVVLLGHDPDPLTQARPTSGAAVGPGDDLE